MSPEVELLAKKFEAHRSKSPTGRVSYPLKLRKAAASLAGAGTSRKPLAHRLGISEGAIRGWQKKYVVKEAIPEMIPVNLMGAEAPSPSTSQTEVPVKVVCMEVKVPLSKLGSALGDLLKGIGGGSC